MRPSIVVADSVTTLDARRADAVLVSGSHGGLIGSHGGLHGGDPESALSVDATRRSSTTPAAARTTPV